MTIWRSFSTRRYKIKSLKPQMLAKWKTRSAWPAQQAVSKSGRHLAVTELGLKANGLTKMPSYDVCSSTAGTSFIGIPSTLKDRTGG